MMNETTMQAILGWRVKKCMYCCKSHDTICPEIKSIEFDSEGLPKRVDLLTPMDRPQESTLGPGEIKFFDGR